MLGPLSFGDWIGLGQAILSIAKILFPLFTN
jgi:hypothetical protein